MKALIQVKKVYRPISRELQGYRLRACIPNENARRMLPGKDGEFKATAKLVPSFTGKYFIQESMDYTNTTDVTDAELARFQERLRWEGFTEFQFVDAKGDIVDSLFGEKKADPKVSARVEEILAKLRTQEDAPF
jgi:hypothetical protein